MPKKTDPDRTNWRPIAGFETLRRRARMLGGIRHYFAARDVLEVDTPMLMPWGSPDPMLNSFVAESPATAAPRQVGYLQTSPEFAMKRLLAAGSGDIYQLCHAFRAEQPGRHHFAEFTMLEWYRLGFDHHQLMDDVEALVLTVQPSLVFERRRYAELFSAGLGLDPHRATTAELADAAGRENIEFGKADNDRVILLEGLFAHLFLRRRPPAEALFVYDFPVEQAAYARIEPGPPAVAQRFELLIGGVEIANGYFEVSDCDEQTLRHQRENVRRAQLGLPRMEPDPLFLAALKHGMPDCAGVALGVDRLMMQCTAQDSLSGTAAFDPFGDQNDGP